MDKYIPFILIFIIIFAELILWTIIYQKKSLNQSEPFDSVIKIMDSIPDVPTINLIEKEPKLSIIQKILGHFNGTKIQFKVSKTPDSYNLPIPDYSDYNFTGKGLVIAASGNRYRYLTGLYSNLYTLRNYHKSNIPIEIFYVGRSEQFSKPVHKMITDLGGITIYNLLDRINSNCSESELRGYQTKPLAVLCSTFEEVILMDADALCFIDPQYLFVADGYANSGMLLFKDYVDCMSFISRDFIETIGIGVDKYCNYTGNFEIDSSCVVMNKKKCWEALYTICLINVKSDSYHKSKNVLGDKDTFIIGSMFVGISPYVSSPAPKIMLTDTNKVIVGHLQSTTFEYQEIFTHYNNQKIDLFNSNLTNYTYTEIKNPKSGEQYSYGLPLTEKVIESFKYAKEAMLLLDPYIPKHLKDGVTFVNGVSKGLI